MAALIAPETSTISGLNYLDRGYEKIDEKLRCLGADIKRVPAGKEQLEEMLVTASDRSSRQDEKVPSL